MADAVRQAHDAGERFPGFPAGGRATAIPNLFFSAVLPKTQDPVELVVTIYLFFAWQRQRAADRYFTYGGLAADATLLEALSRLTRPPEEALRQGLELAVRRGTLLRAAVGEEGRQQDVYLLNTAAARASLARLRRGDVVARPGQEPTATWQPAPNIFSLYEENIGAVSPLIAEELAEAESQYPAAWIEAAFREAVRMNRRRWSYIRSILERWAVEGPDYEEAGRAPGKAPAGKPLSGRYGKFVRH